MYIDFIEALLKIGFIIFIVYVALTKLSKRPFFQQLDFMVKPSNRAMRRAIRKWKRGDYAPPKSFKPVHLPGHSVGLLTMVAASLLRGHTDGGPMLDHEVELLNKVKNKYDLHEPRELPKYIKAVRRTLAEIELAIVVMQKHSHLLKEDREDGEKELTDWEKELSDDFLPELLKGLQKTDWEKELKKDREHWEKWLKEEQTYNHPIV